MIIRWESQEKSLIPYFDLAVDSHHGGTSTNRPASWSDFVVKCEGQGQEEKRELKRETEIWRRHALFPTHTWDDFGHQGWTFESGQSPRNGSHHRWPGTHSWPDKRFRFRQSQVCKCSATEKMKCFLPVIHWILKHKPNWPFPPSLWTAHDGNLDMCVCYLPLIPFRSNNGEQENFQTRLLVKFLNTKHCPN